MESTRPSFEKKIFEGGHFTDTNGFNPFSSLNVRVATVPPSLPRKKGHFENMGDEKYLTERQIDLLTSCKEDEIMSETNGDSTDSLGSHSSSISPLRTSSTNEEVFSFSEWEALPNKNNGEEMLDMNENGNSTGSVSPQDIHNDFFNTTIFYCTFENLYSAFKEILKYLSKEDFKNLRLVNKATREHIDKAVTLIAPIEDFFSFIDSQKNLLPFNGELKLNLNKDLPYENLNKLEDKTKTKYTESFIFFIDVQDANSLISIRDAHTLYNEGETSFSYLYNNIKTVKISKIDTDGIGDLLPTSIESLECLTIPPDATLNIPEGSYPNFKTFKASIIEGTCSFPKTLKEFECNDLCKTGMIDLRRCEALKELKVGLATGKMLFCGGMTNFQYKNSTHEWEWYEGTLHSPPNQTHFKIERIWSRGELDFSSYTKLTHLEMTHVGGKIKFPNTQSFISFQSGTILVRQTLDLSNCHHIKEIHTGDIYGTIKFPINAPFDFKGGYVSPNSILNFSPCINLKNAEFGAAIDGKVIFSRRNHQTIADRISHTLGFEHPNMHPSIKLE